MYLILQIIISLKPFCSVLFFVFKHIFIHHLILTGKKKIKTE